MKVNEVKRLKLTNSFPTDYEMDLQSRLNPGKPSWSSKSSKKWLSIFSDAYFQNSKLGGR